MEGLREARLADGTPLADVMIFSDDGLFIDFWGENDSLTIDARRFHDYFIIEAQYLWRKTGRLREEPVYTQVLILTHDLRPLEDLIRRLASVSRRAVRRIRVRGDGVLDFEYIRCEGDLRAALEQITRYEPGILLAAITVDEKTGRALIEHGALKELLYYPITLLLAEVLRAALDDMARGSLVKRRRGRKSLTYHIYDTTGSRLATIKFPRKV